MAYNKSTNKELVEDLLELDSNKYSSIIERAKTNGYHDFKFDEDKYPDCICPKMDLAEDLSKFPELNSIRTAVINGDYDEAPDADDEKEILREFPFLNPGNNGK